MVEVGKGVGIKVAMKQIKEAVGFAAFLDCSESKCFRGKSVKLIRNN